MTNLKYLIFGLIAVFTFAGSIPSANAQVVVAVGHRHHHRHHHHHHYYRH